MVQKIDKKKLIVTQANTLALSSQKMTLQEKRLLLLLISYVRKDDKEFKNYYIPVKDITAYLDIEKKVIYSRLKLITEKLLSRVINIDEPTPDDDEEDGYIQFQWVSRSRYLPRSKSPIGAACLEMRLHEDLRPWLLNLKAHFANVPLLQMATMPSFVSIRIFEVLYSASFGMTKTKIYFELEDFKRRIGLEGKYINFKDLRRDGLERGQKDCAEKSPIIYTWVPEKQGRKVVGLYFHLVKNQKVKLLPPPPELPKPQENPQLSLTLSEPDPEAPTFTPDQLRAKEALEKNGVNVGGSTGLVQLITEYDAERIIENCLIAQKRHATGEIKTTLARFTVSAIQIDYRKQESLHEAHEQRRRKLAIDQKKEEQDIEKLGLEYEIRRNEVLHKIWESLTESVQIVKLDEFRQSEQFTDFHKGKDMLDFGFRLSFFLFFEKTDIPEKYHTFPAWVQAEKGVTLEKKGRTFHFKK